MTDTFKEGMFGIAALYVAEFQKTPEPVLKMFCNTLVPLEIMNLVYRYLVDSKEIIKIEDLDQGVKEKLWIQAKGLCGNADKAKTIKVCCCIWLINFILEK